jgi:hypothetical protein
MQKWEYAVVEGMQGEHTSNPRFHIFTEFGWESVDFSEDSPETAQPMNAVAQLIARLGEQGWEMVGTASTGQNAHCLYFKRPKP